MAKHAIGDLDKDSMRRIAISARKQLQRNQMDKDRLTSRVLGTASAIGGSAAVGMYMGKLEQQKRTQTSEEDPTMVAGVDKGLALSLAMAIGGAAWEGMVKGKTMQLAGRVLADGGLGGLAGFTYKRAFEKGLEAA